MRLGEAKFSISMTVDIDNTEMVTRAYRYMQMLIEERIEDDSLTDYMETHQYLDETEKDKKDYKYNVKLLNDWAASEEGLLDE